jgi:DNA-binding response OmpR family regulator
MMSGYHEEEVRKRFTGTLPAGFLQKPFTARKLLAQVKLILEQ